MAKRKEISAAGLTAPDWTMVDVNIKPFTTNGIKFDYKKLLQGALWYTHYEISSKVLMAEFLKYCNKKFDKNDVKLLKKLKDWEFSTIGKYTYLIAKGANLDEDLLTVIDEWYEKLLAKAKKIAEAEADQEEEQEAKPKAPVVSIQQRMREQLGDLCEVWDGMIDEICTGNLTTRKFDAYMDMKRSPVEIKAAHAKIVKDLYAAEYEEARLILEWSDPEIKEAYSNLSSSKVRKEYVAFFEKLFTACDTVINEGKATRKTRVKKAPSKQKLVEKLKYKESESTLALASINPLSIVDASKLWVYNTKTRKLGVYIADEMKGPLSVKGTSITGYNEATSTQKTVRKPDVLKGAGKLARTKFDKLYAELTTTETKMNGRINEHTVLIKVF